MRPAKATALTVCAGIIAATWWAGAAPAAARYVPHPVEFERTVPAPAAAGGPPAARSARRSVSRVLRPGKRFNLVGLSWRGGHIDSLSFRARRDRGDWSRWTAVGAGSDDAPDAGSRELRHSRHTSNPLWAGQADVLQIALTGGRHVRDLRLHFVNTTGSATPAARTRTRARTRVRAAQRSPRQADISQPAIVPRAQWAGDKCVPRAGPAYGQVNLAFIHHTVSANSYGPEDSAAMVLAICRYHRNGNRWNDIGYNFLVDRYGTIFEGRAGGIAEPVIGAQAQGYNSTSTGIASLGTFSSAGQTPAGLAAIARLLSWKLGIHGVPPTGTVDVVSQGGSTNRFPAGSRHVFNRISGHRDGDATACPGDGLYAQLPQLRAMVDPGPPRATTQTTASRTRRNVTYGSKALLQLSLGTAGTPVSPLAGRRVEVQVLGRLGWRTNHSVKTDAFGKAETRMRLSLNRRVRARFQGEPGLLPSSSTSFRIGVRPLVRAAVAVNGKLVRVSGAVRPKKAKAILWLKRRTPGGRLLRVSRRAVKLRRGRLRASLRVTRPAEYRLRVSVAADRRNLSARSNAVEFRIG